MAWASGNHLFKQKQTKPKISIIFVIVDLWDIDIFFLFIWFKISLVLGMMNDFQLQHGCLVIILLWILFKPPILAGFS